MKATRILLPLILLFAFFFVLGIFKIYNLDIWLHLATGEYIVRNVTLPRTNIFSWINFDYPMDDDKWLFQVLVFLIFRSLGSTGLIAFRCALIGAAFGLVLATGFRKKLPLLSIAVAAVAVLTASERFLVRPDLCSLFFFSLYFFLLERFLHRKNRVLLLLPLLQVLWANIHGYFILGLILIWIYALAPWIQSIAAALKRGWALPERPFFLPLMGFLAAAACFVNPYGTGVALFPIRTLLDLRGESRFLLENINEFQSPFSTSLSGILPIMGYKALVFLSAGSALLFLLLMLLSPTVRREYNAGSEKALRFILLLAAVLPMTFTLRRNISLLSVAGPPVFLFFIERPALFLKGILASKGGPLKRLASPFFQAVLALLFLLGIQQVASNRLYFHDRCPKRFGLGFSEHFYPFDAIEFIREHSLPERIFNSFDFGALYVWNFFPRKRAFIDGNTFGYPAQFIQEYHEIRKGEKPYEPYFERLGIDVAFLKLSTPLAGLLYKDENWRLIFLGEGSVIFLRNKPQHRALLDRFSIDLEKNPPDPLPAEAFIPASRKEGFWGRLLHAGIYPPSYLDRANFYSRLGLNLLAIRELEEALKVNPSLPEIYINLGANCASLAQSEEPVPFLKKAAGYYEKAIELDPGFYAFQAHANLGSTYLQLGNLLQDLLKRFEYLEKARMHFEEALRLRPEDKALRRNLAIVNSLIRGRKSP